ncbi:MAG: alanine--tRNA ligase [Candidatus Paceibacterota bacterium]|jgi:alanyl-tRNA synthetase
MQSEEIRGKFLRFFEKRGHAIIPSASLVPENDPSVLFNTAGMQPLVPYLLGEPYPNGSRRLVNSQKCVRTTDIDEIGDNTHATFFEMLGNWSLGDYFKEDAIKWSYEFLTSREDGLGLDSNRLYVTVFEGDENAPRDDEAFDIWKKYVPENRIYFMGAKSNWWSPGDNGPCGPDSEMFYDVTEKGLGDMTKEEYMAADDRQDVVEIWNDVFMEYEKKDGKVIGKLKQQNVDTGSGLERVAMVVQGKNNIFDTDLLKPIIDKIGESSNSDDTKAKRIIADHIRTSVFMIADGVIPSNTDRGYVLRRLIRRATYYYNSIGLGNNTVSDLVGKIADVYREANYGLWQKERGIKEVLENEETQFRKTLESGKKQAEKIIKNTPAGIIPGKDAFLLFSTFGYPLELTIEIAFANGKKVDSDGFWEEFKKHQEISRQGSDQKFKGGLADHSETSVKYHTATHLLHKALREVLGNHVFQKGSNITPERLRFDFSHGEKMTDEQKKRVEDMVNEKISEALPVTYEDMPLAEAEKKGAIGLFEEKYGDTVRVYRIGDFSLEFCGGPHVKNTSELGRFKIAKEEACSAGIRRIKAVLG